MSNVIINVNEKERNFQNLLTEMDFKYYFWIVHLICIQKFWKYTCEKW